MTRKSKEFIHEGKYAAEVPVVPIEDDTAWSPCISPEDVHKLDTVRLALRRGDIALSRSITTISNGALPRPCGRCFKNWRPKTA